MDVIMLQEICLSALKVGALYFLGINLIYGLLIVLSWFKIKSHEKQEQNKSSFDPPGVSFLIPAYNEESLIVETIQTYLSLPLEKKEIIIINDGSHDQTMKLLQVMYQLKKSNDPSGRIFDSITQPHLKVVEVTHSGKAQALNAGMRIARFELICTMDADTIPTVRGVDACLKAFARDSKLVAAGGVIQVLSTQELKDNSPLKGRATEWLTSFQRIEYLRTFVCERLGWSFIGSTLLISGAFCMIKKEAINKIGGFSPRSITEDFDLIVRLRKAFKGSSYRFKILPVTTCYTQAPRSLRHLSKQRMRWQMGLIQTLFQNGSLFLHPQHGFLGLLAIPYFWLVEAISPLVSLLAYLLVPFCLYAGWVKSNHVFIFLMSGLLFNLTITMIGIFFEKRYVSQKDYSNLGKSVVDTILLHFGYKQLNTWWRFKALMKAFTKAPSWGEKPRMEIIHQNY